MTAAKRMFDVNRETLLTRIRHALQHDHCGQANAITMAHLYHRVTGYPVIPARKYDHTRVIRSCVDQLRAQGCPIGFVGGKRGGYFWATREAELETTLRVFHSRALSSLRQEAALRKISITRLVQQVEMELSNQEEIAS